MTYNSHPLDVKIFAGYHAYLGSAERRKEAFKPLWRRASCEPSFFPRMLHIVVFFKDRALRNMSYSDLLKETFDQEKAYLNSGNIVGEPVL